MSPEQVKPLRDLDPLLFQGLHASTRTFMWFSTLETPAVNGSKGGPKEQYRVKLNMSWPAEKPEDEVAATNEGRLAFMKARVQAFDEKVRQVFANINEGTQVTEIKLADWPCLDWDSRGGLVSLAGDAADTMTMYRGEAANHGLLDAFHLCKALQRVYGGDAEQKAAIGEYESEMRSRTKLEVAMSRQACIDAHTWENLNENCAILRRRAIVAT